MKNKLLRVKSNCAVCQNTAKTKKCNDYINCKNYCKNCYKHTGNTFPKKLVLISKNKIKGKSKCAICLTGRTFIDETEDKYDLESELEVYFQFFTE